MASELEPDEKLIFRKIFSLPIVTKLFETVSGFRLRHFNNCLRMRMMPRASPSAMRE